MTSPAAALNARLSDALGAHDVDLNIKATIQEAYLAAGGDSATWDALPPEIRQLVEEIEQLPRTSWDDPVDVPEDTPDDF
jgi:hypothetical protein